MPNLNPEPTPATKGNNARKPSFDTTPAGKPFILAYGDYSVNLKRGEYSDFVVVEVLVGIILFFFVVDDELLGFRIFQRREKFGRVV